jgi:Fe-Mn family superoxide dismutase
MSWTLLSFRPSLGALVNHRIAGPVQTPSEDLPILAFQTAGGVGMPDVEAFAAGIDWAKVYERYQLAVHDASEAFGATQDELASARLLDVRRAGMFDKADSMIPGAQWRDPATVGSWSAQLPKDQPVVVYCIYGHEVGRSTAMRLRAQGIAARFLEGGIDAWQTAGRPLVPKGAAS